MCLPVLTPVVSGSQTQIDLNSRVCYDDGPSWLLLTINDTTTCRYLHYLLLCPHVCIYIIYNLDLDPTYIIYIYYYIFISYINMCHA